jgi:hypothetical protein
MEISSLLSKNLAGQFTRLKPVPKYHLATEVVFPLKETTMPDIADRLCKLHEELSKYGIYHQVVLDTSWVHVYSIINFELQYRGYIQVEEEGYSAFDESGECIFMSYSMERTITAFWQMISHEYLPDSGPFIYS